MKDSVFAGGHVIEAKHDEAPSSLFVFGLGSCLLVILAHALAYMTHEYAHSFTAWALGWMSDPLALDYGPRTLDNVLFQGDVGDNVQYEPIFAAGAGLSAAAIALAGVALGNVAPYFLLYRIARSPGIAARPAALSLVFWLAMMCAGNVWSYVPMRAITSHADIALSARGFGVSPWVQLPFLLVPALYVVWHFLARTCARCFVGITQGSAIKLALLVALTSYWVFAFYGGITSDAYGPVTQLLGIASKYFLFPLTAMWLWRRYGRMVR